MEYTPAIIHIEHCSHTATHDTVKAIGRRPEFPKQEGDSINRGRSFQCCISCFQRYSGVKTHTKIYHSRGLKFQEKNVAFPVFHCAVVPLMPIFGFKKYFPKTSEIRKKHLILVPS